MSSVDELWDVMGSSDARQAHSAFRQLAVLAAEAPVLSDYADELIAMLDAKSSYVRTRAFLLLAGQMRWVDDEFVAADLFSKMAPCLHDSKPTVVRQCVQAMPMMCDISPSLACHIVRELERVNPGVYRDSMAPLIAKDVAEALAKIRERGSNESRLGYCE